MAAEVPANVTVAPADRTSDGEVRATVPVPVVMLLMLELPPARSITGRLSDELALFAPM